MDYRAFEQRLLETIFTTDIPITPATIAYLYKIPTEDAAELLQKAAIAGVLNIDSDEQGNLIYQYPNRARLYLSDPNRNQPRDRRFLEPALGMPQVPGLYGAAPLAYQDPVLRTLSSTPTFPFSGPQEVQAEEGAKTNESPNAGTETGNKAKTTRCPFCYETVLLGTKKCPHCHEYLDYALREMYAKRPAYPALRNQQTAVTQSTTSGTQAALLSFFMPGLGQMCNGQIGAGVLWMLFTCLGYVCFVIPGIVLHVLCIINAAKQAQLNSGTMG